MSARAFRVRRLVMVLGDPLWLGNPALAGLDPEQDRVLMIEAAGQSAGVWSHRARIAVFLSAMRHFRDELQQAGLPLTYLALDEPRCAADTLAERLALAIETLQPEALWVCETGEWRLQQGIKAVAQAAGVPLTWSEDRHFLCSRARFADWVRGRKEWRMEHFYRAMRREHRVLMADDEPLGGQWNFDTDNRRAYPKAQGGSGRHSRAGPV